MLCELIACETHNALKRARFFEKMRRTGNDRQFHLAAHLGHRIRIHINDDIICSADDQQRWCFHIRQHAAGEVGSAPSRCQELDPGESAGGLSK